MTETCTVHEAFDDDEDQYVLPTETTPEETA